MTIDEIKELLKSHEYDFLRENPHLKDNILFLCLGGSYAYGTNIDTSDIDIRGVTMNSKSDFLGLTSFEQFTDSNTDTCIYSLKKFLELVKSSNPNIVEMLFCKPSHYLYISPLGQLLLDNRKLFLTRKAYFTFSGYARAQLSRLENTMVRDNESLSYNQVLTHINRSMQNALDSFKEKFDLPSNKVNIYVGQVKTDNKIDEDILIDIDLKGFSLGKLKSIVDELNNVRKDYDKTVGRRNKKKDDLHLNKHMMHLVRLYIMGIEILKTGDLHTYR